jgi:predicted ATPase/DNA-binding winged helix-turn-helix (wHTH) protein
MSGTRYLFGPFSLEMPQLLLRRDGEAVKMGGRALNLLAVLAEAEGELVTHDTLSDRVWPRQTIDESAIRVHLSAARKVLAQVDGGNMIVAEAGRGYRLAVAVTREDAAQAEPALARRAHLPARLGTIFGRDGVIAKLAEELVERRFISVVGPGGIGKTTAATAIARMVSDTHGMNAWFLDLAPVADEAMVAAKLSAMLELPSSGTDLIPRIAARLAAEPALVLFDNCEHVVDEVARIAEQVLQHAPRLLLLATSREPLRAEGEWVHRLAALAVPLPDERTSVEAVAAYAAPALFTERARAVNADFRLDPQTAQAVAEICRKLDGMPLAIELAAARSDTMTPDAILAGLDDRFTLLTRGRRTALPRHRTLRAALDWSYDLLEAQARDLLDRLSLFRAGFDTESAIEMAAGAQISAVDAVDILAELVAKSMVVADMTRIGAQYRLLDTTRQYGLERLSESGANQQARRDHANVLLRRLADCNAAWEGKAPRDWLADFSGQIEDVRSAISWASGTRETTGDARIATEMIIVAAPLWFHLSLPREFLRYAKAAIAALDDGDVECERQIELLMAYGHALWHTEGPTEAMAVAFDRALSLARAEGTHPLALRALWGVWAQQILAGHYAESLASARQFKAEVGPHGAFSDGQTAAHMLALSLHFCGDHAAALEMLNVVMTGDAIPERANHANHAQVDGKIAVMALLMRIKWRCGALPEALEMARDCAQDAAQIDHALSVCYGLAIGCIPVAIAAGESGLAKRWIDALAKQTERHGLDHWHSFVTGYTHALDPTTALPARMSGMQAEMFAMALDPKACVPWR